MSNLNVEVPVPESLKGSFDVCLSFASEDQNAAEELGAALRKLNVRVFDYRKFESKPLLLAENLFDGLANVYAHAPFCVVLASRQYRDKFWTRQEFESIKKRAVSKRHGLIVAYLDEARLEGLPPGFKYEEIGPGKTSLDQLANLIAHLVIKYKRAQLLRRVSFAAAAVLTVAFLVAWKDPSIARGKVFPDKIQVDVSNGWRPMELSNFCMKFHGLPIEDTGLLITGTEWGGERISPFNHTELSLRARQFRTKCNPLSRPPYIEIEPLIGRASVTLEITINNLSLGSKTPKVWSSTFPADQMRLFLKEKIPEYEYPCRSGS